MPIIIDDIIAQKSKVVSAVSPKFFSKDLTGTGRKSGVINADINPSILPKASSFIPKESFEAKRSVRSGSMKTQVLPMSPITDKIYKTNHITTELPNTEEMFHAYSETQPDGSPLIDVYYHLVPQGAVLYIEDLEGGGTDRTLYINYREEIYTVNANNNQMRTVIASDFNKYSIRNVSSCRIDWDYSPGVNAYRTVKDHVSAINPQGKVNLNEFSEWLDNFNVYDAIIQQAELWNPDTIGDHISNMIVDVLTNNGTPDNDNLNDLARQLRYLETYSIPLEAYRQIYNTIVASSSTPEIAQALSKQNINLLISNTLDHLEQLKPHLPTPKLPQDIQGRFSPQQKAAIVTEEPLVMLQAGAGTGKSTTVLGRIDNLIAGGVDPKDITVLSFTNAAADHISDLNPGIGSMTIARMIHDIYCENYTNHELSSIDTMINSLDIFYPNDQIANMFRRMLLDVNKSEPGAFTKLNNFIETYFNEIIGILDKLGQTTLELEIMIAYQRIHDMIEPAHVQSKYLIIDEVQDNSVFEFIYILKYVAKHKENLYIVGDASQTLYEFRSSNPKALNALESSGVFATFKLTTNYRSNQEILDFANIHLADIEANQYANIQLQSNVLNPITADSFQDKVHLIAQHITKVSEVEKVLPSIIRADAKYFIDAALERGEKVAFLAYTRRQVTVIENTIKDLYPDRTTVNITSPQSYPTTVFSNFIKKYWNDVTQVTPSNAPFVITSQIMKNLGSLTRNPAAAKKPVQKMLSDWWSENQTTITGWVTRINQKLITETEFFDDLRDNVLNFEIQHNAIKAALLNEKNKQRKEDNEAANADFIVSTIHGVKGLEFDNVVLFVKYDANMAEDAKRMQYVALTRAMNSELILPYSNAVKPGIETDYLAIVSALEESDASRSGAITGIPNDNQA